MSIAHDIGDAVRLWVAFHNEAGAQAAPTLVTLIVHTPAGVDATVANADAIAGDLTIASAAVGETLAATTGVYKASVAATSAGLWRFEWTGVGVVDEVQSGWFEVRRRMVDDP